MALTVCTRCVLWIAITASISMAGTILNDFELHSSVHFNAWEAMEYCQFEQRQLALSNVADVQWLCSETESKKCWVFDGNSMAVFDAITGTTSTADEDCKLPFICGPPQMQRFTAEVPGAYQYDEIDNDYRPGMDENKVYLNNANMVCMEYQYYFAISILVMVSFASFICLSMLILNKIKDHHTIITLQV